MDLKNSDQKFQKKLSKSKGICKNSHCHSCSKLALYSYYLNYRGKPTKLPPIPNPAPVLALVAIDGRYVSNILNVAAAVNAINAISSKSSDFFGIALDAIATIIPSTKYLIARLSNSSK